MFNKVYQINGIKEDNDNTEFTLCHSVLSFEEAKRICDASYYPAFVESFPIPAISSFDMGKIEYKNEKMIDLECDSVWSLQHGSK